MRSSTSSSSPVTGRPAPATEVSLPSIVIGAPTAVPDERFQAAQVPAYHGRLPLAAPGRAASDARFVQHAWEEDERCCGALDTETGHRTNGAHTRR